jgi:hypothetical protein
MHTFVQVLMNIILFCRILSVDFSYVLRGSSSKSAEHHRKEDFTSGSTQKLNGGADWSHSGLNTYVKSMFDEEPTEGKERKD